MTNLPLQAFAKNQVWLELAAWPTNCWSGHNCWPSTTGPPEPGNPNAALRLLAVAGV